MEVGDLVRYQEKSWVVASYDRIVRLVTLYSRTGEKVELPREYDKTNGDELQVLASPPTQWCILSAPVRAGAGPFVQLTCPGVPGRSRDVTYEPWVDWVPSDFAREGGSIFIRPGARVLPGTCLLLTHSNGVTVRAVVPQTFGTTAQRLARAVKKDPKVSDPTPERANTRFNRIRKNG